MPTHAVSFDISFGRDTAGPTTNPQTSWMTRQTLAITNEVGSSFSANLSPGLIPPSAWRINGAPGPLKQIQGVVNRDTTPLTISTTGAVNYWAIEGEYQANGIVPGIFASQDVAFGRQAPPLQMFFSGNALTALLAGPAVPSTAEIVAHWGYDTQSYLTPTHIMDFEDHPPDSAANGTARVRSLLGDIQDSGQARALLGLQANGDPIYANSCGFAAGLPEGRYFIRPEDVGLGPSQIPALVASNNVAGFRAHPGVFMRRTAYVRAVYRQNVDTLAIDDDTGPSQPFRITTITSAPTSSTWLLQIDGVLSIVRLLHPVNSDYRRPRDIWNALWVPSITTANVNSLALVVAGTDGIQTVAAAALDRLTYLEYARCLDIAGGQTDINQFVG